MAEKIQKTDEEWQAQLTPEQYHVCREKGTERAFSGKYYDSKEDGTYHCACCGEPLFSSEAKFDSGTGWPSFSTPIDKKNIGYKEDGSLWMKRVEVLCDACNCHLGHVFDDGPEPTGKRYCINSVALNFKKNT